MKFIFTLSIIFWWISVLTPQTFAQVNEGYKELDAISNRCTATMPKELCPEVAKDDGIFASLLQSIISLFWDVDRNANINQAVEHAKITDNTYIPVPEEGTDAKSTLEESLCGEGHTGVYTAFLPRFEDTANEGIKGCEQNYDTGLAPEGVNIIIP